VLSGVRQQTDNETQSSVGDL